MEPEKGDLEQYTGKEEHAQLRRIDKELRTIWASWARIEFEVDRTYIYRNWKHAHMLSLFSCVQPFATLWTVPHQAPLSMGLSRQEY